MASVDDLIASSGLKPAIDEAIEDDDFQGLAKLYSELAKLYQDSEEVAEREVSALQRAYLWDRADECADAARQRFPRSENMAIQYAIAAFYARNWEVAALRFQDLRTRFDPRSSQKVAATILTQFLCHYNMADLSGAKKLIAESWRALIYHHAVLYNNTSEIQEIREFIPEKYLYIYDAWLAASMSIAADSPFKMRVAAITLNRNWVRKHASDVTIIALGQNCLPWVLPNRWGLRPGSHTLAPFGPLDFLAAPKDAAALTIDADFAPLLDRACYKSSRYPNRIPVLLNSALGTSFYHEQGPWWAERDWARVHEAYQERVENVRRARRTGKLLYVYCICGEGDHARLIAAYEKHLARQNTYLLVINVLKDAVPLAVPSPRVRVLHIPYPLDYGWNSWTDFDSPRGHLFELQIVEAIRGILVEMKDWRTTLHRRVNAIGRLLQVTHTPVEQGTRQ